MPFSAGSWNSSCSAPATRTAQPSARIGTSNRGANHSAPAIMHKLRMTGVSAGMAKRWKLLSAPPASAVNETNSRNGKVSRNRSTNKPYFSGSVAAPSENTAASCGVKINPSAVISNNIPPKVPDTRAISSRRSACGRVSLTSVNTGTKAVANEPSANSRRRKLGMRKATQNASVTALAPKVVEIAWSRIRPSTREIMVILLNESRPLNMPGLLTLHPS